MSKGKKARAKQKKAFGDAIRADRNDGVTRKIFADWLVEYARECELSFEELIEAANNYIDTGKEHYLPFDTPDIVYSGADEFWEPFSLATGRSVSEDYRGETFFRCAC
jgi:uncharacterized protein (TIGR02996 family)